MTTGVIRACKNDDWSYKFTPDENQSKYITSGDIGSDLEGKTITINVFCTATPCDQSSLGADILIGYSCGSGTSISKKRIIKKEAPVKNKTPPKAQNKNKNQEHLTKER